MAHATLNYSITSGSFTISDVVVITPKVQRRFQADPSIGKSHLVCLLRVRDEATYRVMLLR